MKVLVFDSEIEASKKAYDILKENITENSTLGLATGSTPLNLYKCMIEDCKNGNISFKNIKTFNLDEYVNLEYTHPQSYHYFMNDNLFDHIDIDKNNTFLPDAIAETDEELNNLCSKYNDMLNNNTIDVQILGIGTNGHIGFNEPGTSFDSTVSVVDLTESTIKDNSRFFENNLDKVPKRAISMGLKNIMAAKTIILLAFGEHKKEAIDHLINGNITEDWPCTILQNHPNVYVVIDKAAEPTK